MTRVAAWRERRRRARWQRLGEHAALAAATAQAALSDSQPARRAVSTVLLAAGAVLLAVAVGAFLLGASYQGRVA